MTSGATKQIGRGCPASAGMFARSGRRLLLLSVLVGALLVLAAPAAFAEELPDGRVFEMVTPPENHDADVYVPFAMSLGIFNVGLGGTDTELPFQVAQSGEAVAYLAASTTGGNGQVAAGFGNEYIARRPTTGGWSQVGLQPYGRKGAFYQAFSSDLAVGFLNAGVAGEEGPLSPEAPGGKYPVLYTHATLEGAGGTYTPLFTQKPSEPLGEFLTYNVPVNDLSAGKHQVVFAGGPAGSGEYLFEVHGVLAAGAVDAPEANNLYVSDGGRVVLVNVLPGGGSEPNATFGGAPPTQKVEDPPDFQGVVSGDGSEVFWTDLNTVVSGEDPAGLTRLFVRVEPLSVGARTVQVDVSHGPGPSGGGRYWYATPNGQLVFFTDESRLTGDSTAAPGEPDLYEYEVATGNLKDLTVDGNTGESAGVQGVVGVSEDGSYVYFVAHGVLATNKNGQGTQAVTGGNNLYVLHSGEAPSFIATLSEKDGTETVAPGVNAEFGDWVPGLGHRTAEVTPDGRSVVFESNNQSVNGYSSGLEEVYLYSTEKSRLYCVSCSPSHAAPPNNSETEALIGGFLPPSWSLTYMPTWISSDGSKVFFDSSEPLVPGDTNNIQDVYEWEREGAGACTVGTDDGGCVYLLSGGTSGSASWLIGASADGSDAFVITRAQLTPEDGNEAFNLFDARVGGVRPPTPLACTGTGCQGLPAPAPTFATPASVTFQGVGDFPPPAPQEGLVPVKAKAHPPRRAALLAKALRTCRRKPKRVRAACEKKMRRTYGRGK